MFTEQVKNLARQALAALGYRILRIGSEPWGFGLASDLGRLGVRSGDVKLALDVGANVGKWALHATNSFRACTVHSFEPVPSTFQLLANTAAAHSRIHAHCLALGSETGDNTMSTYEYSELCTLSPLGSLEEFSRKTGEIKVATTSLDAWLRAANIQTVDVLKIDVEGYESHVLSGATDSLQKGLIRFIVIEVKSVLERDVRGPGISLDEVAAFLGPFNYQLQVLYTDWINLPPKKFYTNFNALFGLVASNGPAA